jgi:hypothetical protein
MGFDYPISDLDPAAHAKYLKALQTTAATLFDDLSKKTPLSRPCLEAIGRNLYEDPVVDLLWDQWFKSDRPEVHRSSAGLIHNLLRQFCNRFCDRELRS